MMNKEVSRRDLMVRVAACNAFFLGMTQAPLCCLAVVNDQIGWGMISTGESELPEISNLFSGLNWRVGDLGRRLDLQPARRSSDSR